MKTLVQKTAARTPASNQYWRLLASPIVEKNMCIFYVVVVAVVTAVKNVLNTYFTTVFKTVVKNVLDRQTLYFTVANCWQYLNED